MTAAALLVALALGAVHPARAAAHPLGNFTVNQYSRIEVSVDGIRLVYVLDMAEIPAFQELARVDADGDGVVGDAERATYLNNTLAEITDRLHLATGSTELTLRPVERELTFPDGQAGLKLLRLRAVFVVPLPAASADGVGEIGFRNDFATDRLGWKEVVVTHGPGVRLEASDAPLTDRSDELRAYPDDLLSSPLDRTAATFRFAQAPGAAAALGFRTDAAESGLADPVRSGVGRAGGRFAALVTGRELTGAGILVSLVAALLWGAMHALSPGHGKTVVGAYLVGSRGTPRHALFLGLTVTLTHTVGVLAVGLVTLFASRYVVPERLYPWLSLVSGLLVVGMGLTIFRQRLRAHHAASHHHHDHAQEHHHDHDHGHPHGAADHGHHHDHRHHGDHEHAHAHGHPHSHRDDHAHAHSHGGHAHSHLPPGVDGTPVTWRSLLALGVSGGLVPCPSALVVLLGSIALGRTGFGLLLVIAFSLGLAAALTGIGLVFLYAGRFLEGRLRPAGRSATVLRYAPVAGALLVTLAGLGIIVRALEETRIL